MHCSLCIVFYALYSMHETRYGQIETHYGPTDRPTNRPTLSGIELLSQLNMKCINIYILMESMLSFCHTFCLSHILNLRVLTIETGFWSKETIGSNSTQSDGAPLSLRPHAANLVTYPPIDLSKINGFDHWSRVLVYRNYWETFPSIWWGSTLTAFPCVQTQ